MPSPTPSLTVEHVLTEFLVEQEKQLAPSTFRNYAEIVRLLRDCLNNYGYQSLGNREHKRFEAAYAKDDEAFVKLFGPDKITENLGEFLGYFMIRKVHASKGLLQAAGPVTKKLVKWLGERGYLEAGAVDMAVERAADAARDLPKAERLSELLFEQSRKTSVDVNALDNRIEDYLTIDRVEPGRLWFSDHYAGPVIGPVEVPKSASAVAQAGWTVSIGLGRIGGTWRIYQVGNVYP